MVSLDDGARDEGNCGLGKEHAGLDGHTVSRQDPLPAHTSRTFSLIDSSDYWFNRKNRWVPEIGMVTVFWPLSTTGAGEFVVQNADGPRSVVDWSA